jgi:hypothetical protein
MGRHILGNRHVFAMSYSSFERVCTLVMILVLSQAECIRLIFGL